VGNEHRELREVKRGRRWCYLVDLVRIESEAALHMGPVPRKLSVVLLASRGGGLPRLVAGITTSMLYFGMWRAMFAFHTEDMNLYSINYLHTGRPKSWYSIRPKEARRFEHFAQGHFPAVRGGRNGGSSS
jgi:hypothetical protein